MMEKTVSYYLDYLNLPISKNFCEKLILSHPNYPSLLCITDTLERLGIRYQVARFQKNDISNLQLPYLLKVENDREWLRLIKNQQDLIHLNQENGEYSHCIVLQVDSTNILSDEKNNSYRSLELSTRITFGILILAVTTFLTLSSIQLASWILILLLISSLSGVALGYLLISQGLDSKYSFVETICRGKQKKANTNCDAILNSDTAVLYGNITLSSIVASYFGFQLIEIGLILPASREIAPYLWVLSILSVFTIPIIGYSLYYQLAKVKKWCRLCLTVDAILIIQATLLAHMYTNNFFNLNDNNLFVIANSILLFLAVTGSILLIKTKLKELDKITKNEIKANRIKFSPTVFTQLLTKKKKVDNRLFRKELLVGNYDAPIKIIMAASLTCRPCHGGIEKAIQVVSNYPERVSLAVRFSRNGVIKNNHITESRYILLYWLQNINGQNNELIDTKELLLSWYNRVNIESFIEQYPIKIDDNYSRVQILEDERAKWFDQAGITGTPTFFINGYQLPEEYNIEDLMELAPGLAEQFSKNRLNA